MLIQDELTEFYQDVPTAHDMQSVLTQVFKDVGAEHSIVTYSTSNELGRWLLPGGTVFVASMMNSDCISWMIDVQAFGSTINEYDVPLWIDRVNLRTAEQRSVLKETIKRIAALWASVPDMLDRPDDPLVFLRPLIEPRQKLYLWMKEDGRYRLELPNLVRYLFEQRLGRTLFARRFGNWSDPCWSNPLALAILDCQTGNRRVATELLQLSGLGTSTAETCHPTTTGEFLRSCITGGLTRPAVAAEHVGTLLYGHLVSLISMSSFSPGTRGGRP